MTPPDADAGLGYAVHGLPAPICLNQFFRPCASHRIPASQEGLRPQRPLPSDLVLLSTSGAIAKPISSRFTPNLNRKQPLS